MTALAAAIDVSRRFGDTLAVDRVSLSVAPGEVVGLLGANGAGKTTLIRMMLGLLAPTGGRVQLWGAAPTLAGRRDLGYVPQGLGLYEDLTVRENLVFQAAAFDVDPVVADGDLGDASDVVVGDLPLGLRRRLAFAAALGHRPRLLMLDEPTSGVGPLGRADLWDMVHDAADAGAGVLVSTHYMDEAEQCDRLVILAGGRQVAAGTIAEVIGDQQVVVLEPPDPARVLGRLEDAGLVVLPVGARLHVVAAGPDRVRQVLAAATGDDGRATDAVGAGAIRTAAATLEEAFMAAVTVGRGESR